MGFTLFTFAVGDYVAPFANRTAELLKARAAGALTLGTTGAWLKERQRYSSYNVNVKALSPEGLMRGIRIFEADSRASWCPSPRRMPAASRTAAGG